MSRVNPLQSFEHETAASQALRIPHILSEILLMLSYHQDNGPTLFACSLVNSLWAEEANRLLWEACGENYNLSNYPRLEHLAGIETPRRQKYANYIRALTVKDHSVDPDPPWDGIYLLELDRLSFPRLESIDIYSTLTGKTHPSLPLRQFAQPRLRTVTLSVSNSCPFIIAEEFLQQLQRESLGLRNIRIWEDDFNALDHRWRMPPDRLTSFLQTFKSLESFSTSLEGTMSKASFEVLSLCPHLMSMTLWLSDDSWLYSVSPTSFPAIRELRCNISDRALKIFIPVLAQIIRLHLCEMKGSNDIWSLVFRARFSHLKELNLRLAQGTVLHGNEILLIGHCSQLQRLTIQVNSDERPNTLLKTEDFNDEVINKLAQLLPILSVLYLRCYSEMTENSLISLGNCCPLLQSCHMFAIIDWTKVSDNARSQTWSNLKELYIYNDEEEELDSYLYMEDYEVDEYEDIECVVRGLAQIMPAIKKNMRLGQAHNLQNAFLEFLEGV